MELVRAREVLKTRAATLGAIAGELLAQETLQRAELEALVERDTSASDAVRREAILRAS